MNTHNDPRLSEILAPAYEGTDGETINDALLWRSYLSGEHKTWTVPDRDVTIAAQDFGNLREATAGLCAVARLAQILRDHGGESTLNPNLDGGLTSAICAMAWNINGMLDQAPERSERRFAHGGGGV